MLLCLKLIHKFLSSYMNEIILPEIMQKDKLREGNENRLDISLL